MLALVGCIGWFCFGLGGIGWGCEMAVFVFVQLCSAVPGPAGRASAGLQDMKHGNKHCSSDTTRIHCDAPHHTYRQIVGTDGAPREAPIDTP
jgi:hypothetical protein